MNKICLIEYPKCGRTWIKSFLKRMTYNKLGHYQIKSFLPFSLSHDGMELFGRNKEYKRTGNYDKLSKVIFLARDPRDVMVSFYYYAKHRRKAANVDISKFIRSRYGIEQMMKFYDDWSKLINKNSNRILFLRYEEIKENPRNNFENILKFILIKYTNKQLEDALEYSSFESMKQRSNHKDFRYNKIREGKTGGYINHLSEEDISYINQVINQYDNFIINCYKGE